MRVQLRSKPSHEASTSRVKRTESFRKTRAKKQKEKDPESSNSNEVPDQIQKFRGGVGTKINPDKETVKSDNNEEMDRESSNKVLDQAKRLRGRPKKNPVVESDSNVILDISSAKSIAENYVSQLSKEGVERRPAMLNFCSTMLRQDNCFDIAEEGRNLAGSGEFESFTFKTSSGLSLYVNENRGSLAHVKLDIEKKGMSIEFDVDYTLYLRSISTDQMKPIIKVPRISWNTLMPNLLSDIEVYVILAQLGLFGNLYRNRAGIVETTKIQFEPGKLNLRNHMFQISDKFMFITIDTCVFMDHINTVEFLLNIHNPRKGLLIPVLIVPWVVTQELDGLKKSSISDKAFRARCAVRFIHKHLTLKHPRLIIQNGREANRIRNNQHTRNDDRLLDICFDLINNLGVKHANVYIFTFDDNLQNKTMANELKLLTWEKINELK